MRLHAVLATMVATSSLAFAQTSSWDNWTPGQPVTTTITKTLLHVNENETTTMTSYSSTGTASTVVANITISSTGYSKPASATLNPLASSTTAAIATFSSGAAVTQELDVAIAAIAGLGAVAYGLL